MSSGLSGRILCRECPIPSNPSAATSEHEMMSSTTWRRNRTHKINHKISERPPIIFPATLMSSNQRTVLNAATKHTMSAYVLDVRVKAWPPTTSIHNSCDSFVSAAMRSHNSHMKRQDDMSPQTYFRLPTKLDGTPIAIKYYGQKLVRTTGAHERQALKQSIF